MSYTLERDFQGYEAGTVLRDVPIYEARSWECNRCGDCCDSMSDWVDKDEATGMPKLVWGSNAPEDRYEERYGEPLLIPVVMGDGGPREGQSFEVDADGKPYTAFRCSKLIRHSEDETSCALYHGDRQDPSKSPPLNCGDFPVFSVLIDDAIVAGNSFIPPTGNLPRCTWYGIRVVGPWKNDPKGYWRRRWEDANG